jgi:hypothetical protein
MGKSALKVKFDPTRLPNGDQTQISGFFTEVEAREWIATESAAWLKQYRGGKFA